MINFLKKIFSQNLGYKFSLLYLWLFNRNSYIAHKDYVSSDDGIFEEGTFHTGVSDFKKALKTQTDYNLNDKYIYKGFYSNTLTDELQKKMPKVGVVHIDVDIYSSAKEVLNFIKLLLVKGSVLIFDDYYCFPAGSNKGEHRALNEFLNENPSFKITEWKAYSSFGKSFFITDI